MNKFYSILMASALVCGFSACDDRDDEITEAFYSRVFSPADVDVKIRQNINAEISWTENVAADKYLVEVFSDENYSQKVASVETTALTCTIKGLEGESEYFGRVNAQKDGVTASNWSKFSFKTEPEQTALDYSVTKTSATLRWTPGIEASIISWGEGDDHQHTVTADEIAAGEVTIEGLKPEHTYTFKYLRTNGKQRASWKATTNPLGWPVTTIKELIDAFDLLTPEDNQILIDGIVASDELNDSGEQKYKSVTLPVVEGVSVISFKSMSATDKGVIKGVNFKLSAGVSLSMSNIILDGKFVAPDKEEKDGVNCKDQALVLQEGEGIVNVTLDNCEIRNYDKGVIYGNVAVPFGTVTFNNCRIYDIECNGGDLFDFRKTAAEEFIFTNNTVYNCAFAGRDCFRMDAGGTDVVPAGTITIKNNTFNAVSNNSGKRILYIRLGETFPITFENNVMSNTAAYISNQSTTVVASLENNNYFNAPNFQASEQANAILDSGSSAKNLDPMYKDAEAGDFTITNQDLIDAKIGDLD